MRRVGGASFRFDGIESGLSLPDLRRFFLMRTGPVSAWLQNALVGRSILMEVAGCGCPEIHVWIGCFVVSHFRRSYFENARRSAGSILQVMSIGIAREESRAISRMQDLLTAFRHQHNFSLQDVDELLRPGMPMPLARPGAGGQFEQVDADVLEPCRYPKPMPNLVLAWPGERLRISRAG